MKKVLIIALVGLLIISFFIIQRNTKLNINSNDITEISITSLPSPPTNKSIKDVVEINEFVSILNELDLKKVKDVNEKGWKYLIKVIGDENYTIQIVSSYLIINEKRYETDNLDKLIKFIEELNMLEE
ncbi:hypothetical protein [Clostridium algidicarnis]|uniref:hypothetical protein n=1 Tax=Clostridium algidicarnis TaxID=37659 RepID=UPI001C0B9028|nr:hypothetical protein [Clostridium algidicarnis]MBU3210250.1 hypothetical protein [Clostridium algidicarnis]MBU3228679.1 hypothetical protein [Clostridium algidicarnis]MBU3251275.1 hypothetical protein [Clostridium algidicarnis]